jgi:hypothetical protein
LIEFAGQRPEAHVVGDLVAHAELLDQAQAKAEIELGRTIELAESSDHDQRLQPAGMALCQRECHRAPERRAQHVDRPEGELVDHGGKVVGPGLYGVGRRRLGRAADAARVDRQHLQMPRQERNAKTVIAMIQPEAGDQQDRLARADDA